MKENDKNPQVNLHLRSNNCISKLFFWWVFPFLRLGNEQELETDDLHKILAEDESEILRCKLDKEWIIETTQRKKNKNSIKSEDEELGKKLEPSKPSLTKALYRSFGKRFFTLGFLEIVVECLFRIVQPICLAELLRYFEPESLIPAEHAYIYATGVVLGSAFQVIIIHSYVFNYFYVSMNAKAALRSLIYKKCLRLNQESLCKINVNDEVSNLMFDDVDRLDSFANSFHFLWVAPLQCVITTAVMCSHAIGPLSVTAGMALLILFIPLQIWMGRLFVKARLRMLQKTSDRVRNMREIISGMRFIKFLAWEELFIKLVNLYRRLEVKFLRQTAMCWAIKECLFFSTSKVIILLIFLVYVRTDNNLLTTSKAFLAVALMENFRLNMSWYFPLAITSVAQARISIQRIETFLMLEEVKVSNHLPKDQVVRHKTFGNECQVYCKRITVRKPEINKDDFSSDYQNILTNISFAINSGQILTVIGDAGSGKSSLLNLLLGELKPLTGRFGVNGTISYASQEPWIFPGTIRQNILCGLDYNVQRYNKVIIATGLNKDFSILTHGDQTDDAKLTKRQKSRINLARCLYVDADIYLIDDPFSSTDPDVGRNLFREVINGFLRDKIRILTSRHLHHYLRDVNQLLVLKAGRMEAVGTYEALKKNDMHLAYIISPEKVIEHCEKENVEKNELEEKQGNDEIGFSTYWDYLRAGSSYFSLFLFGTCCIIAQSLLSVSDYWLTIWINPERIHKQQVDTNMGVYIYSILIGLLLVFSFIRCFQFAKICIGSSIKLHDRMLKAVVQSPISFFNHNSVDNILKGFTKDLETIDDQLPPTFFDFISRALYVFGTIVVLGVINIWLIVPAVFLSFIIYGLAKMYLKPSRNLKRLEITSRSRVFSHVFSSLAGLTTVRAHKCQSTFQRMFDQFQDAYNSACYISLAAIRWFGLWTDCVVVIYIGCVTYTCVALRESINSSEAGLAISSVITLNGLMQWGIRQLIETGNQMIQVKRLIEYGKLTSETAFHGCITTEKSWPQEGSIKFDNVSIKADKLILKNVSFFIQSKEKISIIGQKGAGKSLIAALFQLTQLEGNILIDGMDTKMIGLNELRSKISIIPQDPILFSGTLRLNLDPFEEYSDSVLRRALGDVKCKRFATNIGLDFNVSEGGCNLSMSERQLICLARAVLCKNRILIVDEANIDLRTCAIFQSVIRDKFNDCTVLSIAHRLNTVTNSDRVMVIDDGFLKEFDQFDTLLKNPFSNFCNLMEQIGFVSESSVMTQ